MQFSRQSLGGAALLSAWIGSACVPSTNAEPAVSQDFERGETGNEIASVESETPPPPSVETKPAYVPREQDLVTVEHPIENVERLAPFFDALAAVDDGEQGVVRIVNVGASAIGADDLPSIMRERFQTRFGDGGAGLVLMARYMDNYLNRWVKLEAEGWDHCYLAYKCLPDGHYGLGGTAFWASSGASTTISTRKQELGDEVSNVELWYLARPGGGRVEIKIDKQDPVIVDTRAEALEDRFHTIDVEAGPHSVRVRPVGHGPSRLYGVVLETDGPGVVWDGISKLGVFTNRVLEWDAEHLAGQIRHRDPDLLVFTYGGNDTRRVDTGKLDFDGYVAEFRQVVDYMRAGKPEAACLVMSISDRGKSLEIDLDDRSIEVIVDAQREVAKQAGCAFFDIYGAMGGPNSFEDWRKRGLAAGDHKHLSHKGRELLGGWMYDAMIAGYVAHRQAQ